MPEPLNRDDPIHTVAASLPMIARMNRRLLNDWRTWSTRGRSEDEWKADLDSLWAHLDSIWVRSRYLIHFLNIGGHGPDVVRVGDYWPGWRLQDKKLRRSLSGYERQASKIVAHLLRDPAASQELSSGMPREVIAAYRALIDDAPAEHAIREALGEAVVVAERAL